MKKSIVFGLVALALIVFVSPGIIGKIAEDRVKRNIDWAATSAGDGELKITSERFDSGWFVSEGEHRITLADGQLQKLLVDANAVSNPDDLPELVIQTRLDHGLIPVTSMSREKGTLAPSLGSAVSKLRIEAGAGEVFEMPGEIYSVIGLGGSVDSRYELTAGSTAIEDASATWGDTRIRVTTNAVSGRLVVDATSEGVSVITPDGTIDLGAITVSGNQAPSKFDVGVGEYDIEIESLTVRDRSTPGRPINLDLGPVTLAGNSALNGDRLGGDTRLFMAASELPGIGAASLTVDFTASGLDAAAVQNVTEVLDSIGDAVPPDAVYALLEDDLKTLASSGFSFDFKELDIELPQGIVDFSLAVNVAETDAGDFSWGNVLQAMSGKANLQVPAPLMDLALSINPQAQMLVGMGFLQKSGEVYEAQALYEQGLLTVNGAPIPIPMPR